GGRRPPAPRALASALGPLVAHRAGTDPPARGPAGRAAPDRAVLPAGAARPADRDLAAGGRGLPAAPAAPLRRQPLAQRARAPGPARSGAGAALALARAARPGGPGRVGPWPCAVIGQGVRHARC